MFQLSQLAFQDGKDFTVQVKTNCQNNCVYSKSRNCDAEPRRLFNDGNKFSVKVMVSAAITWKGIIKPFFVREKVPEIDGNLYCEHLQNEMIPWLEEDFPNNDFIFIQETAPFEARKFKLFEGKTEFMLC